MSKIKAISFSGQQMDGTTLKLFMPPESQTRNQIRRLVNQYFNNAAVIPPITFQKLNQYATSLMTVNNWEYDNYAFVLICCGNAVWRKIMATIPFHRRILLLPECLRDSKKCIAETDELGLICKDCGNCSISGIINYAEDLGYRTIVAEGTTLASKLIESGKIDAIVGVGCMESLQKIFNVVTKYSLPALGVPLLYNGCVDTTADLDWLKEEICEYEPSGPKLIKLQRLKDEINSIFTSESITKILGPAGSETENIARQALLSKGNRWRPMLSLITYQALTNNIQPKIQNAIALAVECFHKASLIHDDIEDNDTVRNGSETIHKKYGVPVALNLGDLLIGKGYKIITNSAMPYKNKEFCLQVASQGHVDVSIGQGEELLSLTSKKIIPVSKILEIFKNKTAAAFKVALLMGAAATETNDETLTLLNNFSENLGIAYQIQDDIADYHGNKGDILSRQFSILLSLLYEVNDNDEKHDIHYLLAEGDDRILTLIDTFNIVDKTEQLLHQYINKAYDSIETTKNATLKLVLYEIMGKMFRDYL